MRYVTLDEAKPNMMLAYRVYDSFGHILVNNDTVLTEQSISKLKEYGLDGVYITDSLSDDICIEPVITPELRNEGLECVREGNIEKCQEISKEIVKQILNNDMLSLDLTDLRTYDDYTYAHSINVAVLCCIIAFGMKMGEKDMEQVVTAAVLHDLGKLEIPDEILNKPGRLTQEEYEVMKTHSTISYELIKDRWDVSAQVKAAVLYHHENVDGSGYPSGLTGEEMTILTKILHVADVYDALTAKRPYKEPYSPFEACEYLMGACGIMFEKSVVESLMKYVPLYPRGTLVTLSNNNEAIIYENIGIHNLRPIVRLITGELLDLSLPETYNITILRKSDDKFDPIASEDERKKMLGTPQKKYRIMVVDDMASNLHAMREMLKNLYDVVPLKDGYKAISQIKDHVWPDLIIMDIDMPKLNGIDTARIINEFTGGKIPILYVTDLCDKQTVMMCHSMKAAGYIVKPYNPVFVKSEIRRILRGRSDTE